MLGYIKASAPAGTVTDNNSQPKTNNIMRITSLGILSAPKQTRPAIQSVCAFVVSVIVAMMAVSPINKRHDYCCCPDVIVGTFV